MPKQFINKGPLKRRVLGYLTRTFRDLVSGADAGYTITKMLLVLSITFTSVVVTSYAWPIILAGAGVGGLYAILSLIDEYLRNRAENLKLAELDSKIALARFVENCLFPTDSESDSKQELQKVGLSQDEISNNKDQDAKWLRKLLHKYFKALEIHDLPDDEAEKVLNKKRKANGRLPGQEGIIRIIEGLTGLNRNEPLFATKVAAFLRSDQDHQSDREDPLVAQTCSVLKLTNVEPSGTTPKPKKLNNSPWDQFRDALAAALNVGQPEGKKKPILTRLYRVIKNAFALVARGNTALAFVVGSSVLLVVVIGWPVFLIGGTVAVLSGAASLLYQRFVEKDYIQNMANIESKIKNQQAKYELFYKLNHLKTKQQYADLDVYDETPFHFPDGIDPKHIFPVATRLSKGANARTNIDILVQIFYGLGVGMVVGGGIGSVLLVLFALTVLGPLGLAVGGGVLIGGPLIGLGIGAIFGLRYGYMLGKASQKARLAEAKKIKETAELTERSYENLSHISPQIIKDKLAKSMQELVAELIDQVTSKNTYGAILKAKHSLLDKREKLLQKIETLGFKREIAADGLSDNYDPKFYQSLRKFLQQDPKTKADAAAIALKFKKVITGDNNCVLESPTSKLSWQRLADRATKESTRFWKHAAPFISLGVVAIPLAFVIFGTTFPPMALVPILTIGVLMGLAWGIHKFCEWKSEQSIKKQTEDQQKLVFIEAIEKTKNRNKIPRPVAEKRPAKAENEEPQKSSSSRTTRISPVVPLARWKQSTPPSPLTRASSDFFSIPRKNDYYDDKFIITAQSSYFPSLITVGGDN